MNPLDIQCMWTQAALTVSLYFFIQFWFGKYFTLSDGEYVDITGNANTERVWGTKRTPMLNGITLKILARATNSLFGQTFLAPIFMKESQILKMRKSICDHKPTFYPVRLLPDIDNRAKSTDRIDHIPLKNKFLPGWRPITIDDYT